MKRGLILSVLALVTSVAAYAQMMPDSTVQVCAYWAKGDHVEYDCLNTQYNVDQYGNESGRQETSETRVFDVLEETDESYTLRMSFRNINSPSPYDFFTDEQFKKINENYSITVVTNQYGTITDIPDVVVDGNPFFATLDEISEDAWKNIDKETRKAISKDDFISSLRNLYSSEETVASTVLKDVTPMLLYHGARLDTSLVYPYKKTFFDLFGGKFTFTTEAEFWVDEEYTDSVSVVIHSDAILDKEDLFPVLIDNTVKEAQANADEYGEVLTEDDIANITDEFNNQIIDMTIEEYTSIEIDLYDGWPIQWFSTREVTVVGENGTQKTIVERTAKYHIPEE